MAKPKLVYLDSSDWSNLASATGAGPFAHRDKWLDVHRRLVAARDAGLAEFRFSQVTITEAYPTSANHFAQGVARARAIAELCGRLCLLEANTLARREARMLALGMRPPFDRAIALRDDNAWHADPDDLRGRLGAALSLDARTMVRDLMKTDLSRISKRARRQIEDALVDSRGRLVGAARDRLLDPAVAEEVQKAAAEKLGLPADTAGFDVLGRVMAGELPPDAADEWVIGLLRDLPTFFSVVRTQERADQFFGYLRKAGQNIVVPLAEAADNMKKFASEYGLDTLRQLQGDRPFLDTGDFRATTRERIISRLWESERKRRGPEPRVRGEAWFKHVNGSPFGSLPSLDAFLAGGTALMGKTSVPSMQPYRGRESDAGDVSHMSYLPYVDVFRCDRGNSQIAQAVISELMLSARVAPTIEDLLALIEG